MDSKAILRVQASSLFNPAYARSAARPGRSLAALLLPSQVQLAPNYPNPFNPQTAIPLALPQAGPVRLMVFNALGQKVRTLVDGPLGAGFHTLVWHGRDDAGVPVGAGVYFYSLENGQRRYSRKMVLVK